jgi:hypothetical protein
VEHPDPPPVMASFEEREAKRESSFLRVSGAVMVALVLSCGGCWLLLPDLCGEEDVVLVVSPSGRAEGRTFLWNCGATTAYVNVAVLKVDGWPWDHERELYSSQSGGMPQLRWAAADKRESDRGAAEQGELTKPPSRRDRSVHPARIHSRSAALDFGERRRV